MAKPGAIRREVPDGQVGGLYLVIQPSGARSWAFHRSRIELPAISTSGEKMNSRIRRLPVLISTVAAIPDVSVIANQSKLAVPGCSISKEAA